MIELSFGAFSPRHLTSRARGRLSRPHSAEGGGGGEGVGVSLAKNANRSALRSGGYAPFYGGGIASSLI